MSRYVAAYCPVCGAPTFQVERSGRLRPVCTRCGHVIYFDPKVAAVSFITEPDRVLLVQRAMEPGRGLWALAGGFVEAGEHPHEAAARETREETGLEVRPGRLLDVFHAQQDGGVITIAYSAVILGGAIRPGDDAADVRWFTRSSLPELVFVSTHALVARWLKGEI